MLKTGDVIEINLEGNFGYGYFKVVLSEDVNPSINNQILIYVYDFHSLSKLENCERIDGSDWLVNPILLSDFRGISKNSKVVCNKRLEKNEMIIPDYREVAPNAIGIDEEDCSVISNFSDKRIWPIKYMNCKHLGEWIHFDAVSLRYIITFLWRRKLGFSIEDSYVISDLKNNWKVNRLLEISYRMVLLEHVPILNRFRVLK